MTKKELIKNLRAREGMTWDQATRVVNSMFAEISDEVAAGNKVYIPKFGQLFAADVAEKRCVHPATKEDVILPAHKVVRFRMAEDLKRRLKA